MSRYGERTRIGEAVSALGRKPDEGIGYGVATLSGVGAASSSITVSSVNYTLLTAINDGTLTVSVGGLFDCLLVGGGGAGGGGGGGYGTGGGGGGGGVVKQTVYLDAGSYTVDVGAGGTGSSTPNTANGRPTSIFSAAFFELTAVGGGSGANPGNNAFRQGMLGGSGGGQKNIQGTTQPAGVAIQGQGNIGGNGGTSGNYNGGGGGGGGAGAVGGNGSGSVGGNGGNGTEINTFISGASTIKAGGGSGGGLTQGTAGTGNGSNNTGGGGDGRSETQGVVGTNGFSGIAYIRFKV